MAEIFTIGYGNRTIEAFIALLKQYDIELLVDVRSQPYSRYNPDFGKSVLSQMLKRSGIDYRFMGDSLGGRPDDSDCYSYSPDRKKALLDPKKCETRGFYNDGIARLKGELARGQRVALMCSELAPQNCHRSYVIGRTLHERERLAVVHIDRNGERTPHASLPDMVYQEQLL